MKKKFLIFALSALSAYSFAGDTTEYLHIQFKGEGLSTVSNISYSLPEGLECGKKDYTFGEVHINKINEEVQISVTGPYKTDQRLYCTVQDGFNPNKVDKTYWTSKEFVVTYNKNNRAHECRINEEFGFGYNTNLTRKAWDKLQAQYNEKIRTCGEGNLDTYTIQEGSDFGKYDSGKIIITVAK